MFRYFEGIDKINFINPPKLCVSKTRGHKYKIEKESTSHSTRRIFLFNRSLNDWNLLPKNIIEANTVYKFKNLIDSFGMFKIDDYHNNSDC